MGQNAYSRGVRLSGFHCIRLIGRRINGTECLLPRCPITLLPLYTINRETDKRDRMPTPEVSDYAASTVLYIYKRDRMATPEVSN